MLDSRSPGDLPPDMAPLKRERSGSRKILTIPELAALRERLADKTIVLCHGAFDLVHMGHVLHFEEAASLGDVLVVTITADKCITKRRSVSFSEEYRARQVAALESCARGKDVERVQRELERERLLMKIRLMSRELAS